MTILIEKHLFGYFEANRVPLGLGNEYIENLNSKSLDWNYMLD